MQKFRNTTKICAVLLALLLLFSGCTVPAEISVTTVQTGKNDLADPHAAVVPFTDSLGNEFDTVPETPRVIALYGSFAQCWLLSGGTLVGVTEDAAEEFRNTWQILAMDGSCTVNDMMEYLKCSDKTVYARIKKLGGEYVLKKGRIYLAGEAPAET